jgi:hypothetical protein
MLVKVIHTNTSKVKYLSLGENENIEDVMNKIRTLFSESPSEVYKLDLAFYGMSL